MEEKMLNFIRKAIDVRVLLASSIGNALEFYEFTIFGFLAPIITKLRYGFYKNEFLCFGI